MSTRRRSLLSGPETQETVVKRRSRPRRPRGKRRNTIAGTDQKEIRQAIGGLVLLCLMGFNSQANLWNARMHIFISFHIFAILVKKFEYNLRKVYFYFYLIFWLNYIIKIIKILFRKIIVCVYLFYGHSALRWHITEIIWNYLVFNSNNKRQFLTIAYKWLLKPTISSNISLTDLMDHFYWTHNPFNFYSVINICKEDMHFP